MFFDKFKQEPRMEITDIFGGMCLAIGFLIFLTIIHILAIESAGNVSSVLNTTFMIMLRLFETLLIIGMAFIVIHFLRWMVWKITTPQWEKDRIKSGRNE